ncbi:MAG TPA: hypothetical protein PKW35_23050 [Nannocystaceae bacterium]|nr:hypothetical protein [Nannocystaceae bacterium]
MSLVNCRRARPQWSLPPQLVEHVDRSLADALGRLDDTTRLELEHVANLVRAGHAAPETLLRRLHGLDAAT